MTRVGEAFGALYADGCPQCHREHHAPLMSEAGQRDLLEPRPCYWACCRVMTRCFHRTRWERIAARLRQRVRIRRALGRWPWRQAS